MSDLIDRQAAIDALGEEPLVWYDGEDELAERNQWRRDVDAIKAVPPAQPESEERTAESAQNVSDDELISRKAAIDALADYIHNVDKVLGAGKLSAYDCKDAARSVLGELPSAQQEIIRINLNEPIKVKLTDWGKEIYYHQYDRINQIAGRKIYEPRFPKEDENGYTEFQLWCFIELYGEHMGMTMPNVIEPLEIVYKR
jgi:hypothetical protein